MSAASEEAVVFQCDGDELVGIYHAPAGRSSSSIGVIVLVGGPQYRVGSHRQFVLMARRLAADGYPVLRFDFRGMGDSSGPPRGFEQVQDDIRSAVDAMMAKCPGMRAVVLFGLCDAASAALMYGASDERVRGLMLANPWVRTPQGEAAAYVSDYYSRRILQRSFWNKLLTGRVGVKKAVSGFFRLLRVSRTEDISGRTVPGLDFVERMRRGLAGFDGPVLVLLSGRDLTAREFIELTNASPGWGELMRSARVTRVDLPQADHTFSSSASLAQANEACIDWMQSAAGRRDEAGAGPV